MARRPKLYVADGEKMSGMTPPKTKAKAGQAILSPEHHKHMKEHHKHVKAHMKHMEKHEKHLDGMMKKHEGKKMAKKHHKHHEK